VATRTVDDPFSTTGGKIVVTASLRDDPLGRLYKHKQIGEHQYQVGLKVQGYFELAGAAAVRAMDPTEVVVDGRAAYYDDIADKRRKAFERLQDARVLRRTRLRIGARGARRAAVHRTDSQGARRNIRARSRVLGQTLSRVP
jgi:hypothetical protein